MRIFLHTSVLVTSHAVYQFSLRFGSEAPTTQEQLRRFHEVIQEEVQAAIEAGRVSGKKPPTLYPPSDPTCIYVWTPSQQRIYSLRYDEEPSQFVVTTTMRAAREPVAA